MATNYRKAMNTDQFESLEGEALFNALTDAGVLFGRPDSDFVYASTPMMQKFGIPNGTITALLDTPLWIPSESIPHWAQA